MNRRPFVFTFPGQEALAARLTAGLKAEPGNLTIRRFPDGETYVWGETPCHRRPAILVANLHRPDEVVVPLLFAARALRELGASHRLLVTPYLAYLRQDASFKPGEVITSRVFAELLNHAFDGLMTIDPHLHRYPDLGAIYSIPCQVRHAAPAIASWIRANVKQPLIVGPDAESEQWVREVAERCGAPLLVLNKSRRGDYDVEIEQPLLEGRSQCTPVLVDDIISTARTMIECTRNLRVAGYAPPVCIGVHAVFSDRAYEDLLAAGAGTVVTCNTIEHPSNAIDVTAALVDGVRDLVDVVEGEVTRE